MKILNYEDELFPEDEEELETYLKTKSNYGKLAYRDILDPSASWAYPFVTGHKYKAHWGEIGIDFTEMKMEMSERWKNTDKPIFMVHNFTNQRHALEVYNQGVLVENNTLPKEWDPTGATEYQTGMNLVINGTMDDPTAELLNEGTEEETLAPASEQGNKFIKYIISPSERNDMNTWERQTLRFKAIYCLWHCNVEVDEEDDVEMVDYYWSEAATWAGTDAGRAPTDGEDLVIPRSWNLIIDVP